MEMTNIKTLPHPFLLEALFAFKKKVSNVFRDVLGLHEIHHLAVSRVDASKQILSFSSTPAMEFNLFSTALWQFDQTYHWNWLCLFQNAAWQTLYSPERYDELYYLKQIKHQFPLGQSMAVKTNESAIIYSFASHESDQATQELFLNQQDDFNKIGQYCNNLLSPIFKHYDELSGGI